MKILKQISYIIPILIMLLSTSFPQTSKENWINVISNNDYKVFVNESNLTDTNRDDIYVWVMEDHSEPISLEGIEGKISQVKTYYLLNNTKMRYSILQVIYYDNDKNVIKSFSYEHNSDLTNFRYSAPILKNTDIEIILTNCLELINSRKN